MRPKKHILPIIILSQFACTSLWFAGNAVADDLVQSIDLGSKLIPYILSSVQLGFIVGTLSFAFLMIADRFSPSRVFLVSALLAASCNIYLLSKSISLTPLLLARFGTGFFLAGIYPVGMKIAADYFNTGLGKALGYLVGALVLGTAFPHLLKWFDIGNDYRLVVVSISILASLGGVMLWFLVPDGPYRKPASRLKLNAFWEIFGVSSFRRAAFGYFGHMWELYAFWAFVPLALALHNRLTDANINIPLWSFLIIGIGSISCIIGGKLSLKFGSRKVAMTSLLISGCCCLLSPVLFKLPTGVFLTFYILWGMAVIADSPQFSTLVAQAAPSKLTGTALTLTNCIGFAVTIVSIQLLSTFSEDFSEQSITYLFLPLAIGPIFGLVSIAKRSS
ncbi:MFS transporter [Sungkyunkwania multivorans]|uniref:MFS transporter n=1 Tax=Sungkyunkwania multivorans TaxID=1173618 RepID=A0ABW3CUC9_9FLAO